jgi:hypothetical protein
MQPRTVKLGVLFIALGFVLLSVAVLKTSYHHHLLGGWMWVLEAGKWAFIIIWSLVEARRMEGEDAFIRVIRPMLAVSFITDFALLQILRHSH